MFVVGQIIDDPCDPIPIPPELRHGRRLEVVVVALDEQPEDKTPCPQPSPEARHVDHRRARS